MEVSRQPSAHFIVEDTLFALLELISRPTTKEAVKKEWKDFQTNARFSLFRASKKLERKTDF